jgi:hypothetical protein
MPIVRRSDCLLLPMVSCPVIVVMMLESRVVRSARISRRLVRSASGDEGRNYSGARVQSAFRLQCCIGPAKRPLPFTSRYGTTSQKTRNFGLLYVHKRIPKCVLTSKSEYLRAVFNNIIRFMTQRYREYFTCRTAHYVPWYLRKRVFRYSVLVYCVLLYYVQWYLRKRVFRYSVLVYCVLL